MGKLRSKYFWIIVFVLISFGWSWIFWQISFAFGVFGPLIGYLVMRFLNSDGKWRSFSACFYSDSRVKKNTLKIKFNNWKLIFLIPFSMLLPTLLLSFVFTLVDLRMIDQIMDFKVSTDALNVFIVIVSYFLGNLFTSGTEEFGWRKFLFPSLVYALDDEEEARGTRTLRARASSKILDTERSNTEKFWKIAWVGGLIWAFWHLPILLMQYWTLGVRMLPVLIGFFAAIIAMNYLSNLLYLHSKSIVQLMVFHALNNTSSFIILLFFPETPFLFVPALVAWIWVWKIEKTLLSEAV